MRSNCHRDIERVTRKVGFFALRVDPKTLMITLADARKVVARKLASSEVWKTESRGRPDFLNVAGQLSNISRIFKIVATAAAIQPLMNIPAMAQSAPRILLIAREPLKPGAQAEYDRIESETALLAAKLGCPHPYLALQPLTGAKSEVWWFNSFDSQDELNLVGEAYKTNAEWNAALTKNQKRKEPLTGKAIEQLADLEPHADSQPWTVGRARFVMVAINSAVRLDGSNVFKGRDDTRYEILMANSREEAERAARGKDFLVLEAVPRWSFPASEWVDGNREMWKPTSKSSTSH